jgi:hypothetical protein
MFNIILHNYFELIKASFIFKLEKITHLLKLNSN